MGVLNLVHELMHSFGAKHDPDPKKRPDCTPEDKVMNESQHRPATNAKIYSLIHHVCDSVTTGYLDVHIRVASHSFFQTEYGRQRNIRI